MKALSFAPVLLLASGPAAAESLYGDWARGDGQAHVKIASCGKDICAVNTWVSPSAKGENSGDVLVMTVKPESATVMRGTAWDPQRKLDYNLRIETSDTRMTTRGCLLLGLLCKDMNWTRLSKTNK